MKTKVIGYWATTAILVFGVLTGGAAQLAHRRENVEGMVHLGSSGQASSLFLRSLRGRFDRKAVPSESSFPLRRV